MVSRRASKCNFLFVLINRNPFQDSLEIINIHISGNSLASNILGNAFFGLFNNIISVFGTKMYSIFEFLISIIYMFPANISQ